jgi:hypothetical protein
MSLIQPGASSQLTVGSLLVVLCACAAAQTVEPIRDIYTCVDAKGRKLTSDRKIPECIDREQKILNPSGTVKSRVGPTLTAQEREQLETQGKSQLKDNLRLEEEKKRDRVLLVRYPNEELHQRERDESLHQVLVVKQAALLRTSDLLNERSKLQDELAFYVKDFSKAPIKLRQQHDSVSQALAVQGRFLAERDAEVARINARFDEELTRLRPLWRMNAAPVGR